MDIFKIKEGLPQNEEERKEQIDALKEVHKNSEHTRLFEFLYENLNILDSKASTLLSFNSINIAIASIFLVSQKSFYLNIPFYTCITFLIISCTFCLKIIWIHWSSTKDLKDTDEHITLLFKVRFDRTIFYRRSWWLSVISVIILLFSILITVTLKSIT